MIRAATRAAIESALSHDAVYRGHLANHLPMVLVALEGLGADDAAIAAYARDHSGHLEPLRPVAEPIVPGEEMCHLGHAEAFPAWRESFAAAITRDGRQSVLHGCCDRLLEGVSAGAFHGTIRTAYAIESESAGELAHALGYWAAAWQYLGTPARAAGTLTAREVLARMAADPALAGRRRAGRNIAERTAAAARDPAVAACAAAADPKRLDLDAIAHGVLHAYAGSGDFTVLHMVTGVHAARQLLPYARDRAAALAHLWFSVVAAYAGAGCPGGAGWADEPAAGWDELRPLATRCDDEHDVKLAYTCWREWQRTGDDLYRRAAAARIRHAIEETKA